MHKHRSIRSENAKKTKLGRDNISAIAYDKVSGKILLIHHFSILSDRKEHSLESIRKEVSQECSELSKIQNNHIEIIFCKPDELGKMPRKIDPSSKTLISNEGEGFGSSFEFVYPILLRKQAKLKSSTK